MTAEANFRRKKSMIHKEIYSAIQHGDVEGPQPHEAASYMM